MKKPAFNLTMLILTMVMVVNAFSYGMIIPLLYPYALQFGMNNVAISILLTSFSLAQFVATPVIGRLSDKYGRKPLLLFSLFGTALSLAFFASAQAVWMLFVARIMDGITGGNMSVAQAVIADSTEGKDRAKAFGMLGASFGFGFLVGPAAGSWLSTWGLSTPFWFAAGIALIGTILGVVFLPETLKPSTKKVAKREPFIDVVALVKAVTLPSVGVILILSFLSTLALNTFIFGFQSYTNEVLKLSVQHIGFLFSAWGIVSMLMQVGGIPLLMKLIPSKKVILVVTSAILLVVTSSLGFATSLPVFLVLLVIHMIVFAPQSALLTALISERTKAEDQGGMLGINQSYLSLGQIIGPLLGGVVAQWASIPMVFVAAGSLFGVCLVASRWLFVKPIKADI